MANREGPSRRGFRQQALAHFSWSVEGQGKASKTARAARPAAGHAERPLAIHFGSDALDYVRAGMAVDHAEAINLRAILRDQSVVVANRDGIDVGKAYKRIVDAYRAMPDMDKGDVMFRILSGLARQERKFRDPEETMSFVTFLGDALRDALEAEPNLVVRTKLFLRRFYCAFALVESHRACDPRPDVADPFIPSALHANALTLWAEVNCLVPPCRYLRLERLLRDRGIQPDAAHAVLRKHGADPLDDLVDLLARGELDEPGLWAMAVADELPHDPSFARLPKPPTFTGNRFAAALEYAFPGWKALDRCETPRDGLFANTHAYRPGWYRATPEETPNPNEKHAAILGGLKERLKLDGPDLDAQAARVLDRFGTEDAPTVILFALDLFAQWGGNVSSATCLRAARATRDARIPDSLAFDLFALFGRAAAEETAALVEDGLIRLRECNRLLRHPQLVVEQGPWMRAFLTRYHETFTPADIAAFSTTFMAERLSPRPTR